MNSSTRTFVYHASGTNLRKYSSIIICSLILFVSGLTASAQTPRWNWAKGVGGSHQDGLIGYSGTAVGTMHTDSLGNVYELINAQSSSITFGTFSFTNPNGSGGAEGYFVKYGPLGNVLWAKQFPQIPAAFGGGCNIPYSMFTDQRGHSFLLFDFRDSLRLGNMFLMDTSIYFSITGGYSGYCIAEYDQNGNVIALHAHKMQHSVFSDIYPFNGNQILGLGNCPSADTLSGHPIAPGYFLSVMDSLGNIQILKNIGYDSLGGTFLAASNIGVSNRSAYISLQDFNRSFIYQSTLPIGNPSQYNGSHLLIRLDSLLDFQWYKKCSSGLVTYAPLYADQNDNVYMDATGNPGTTLIIDTSHINLPNILPSGTYDYHGVVKINSSGILQWSYIFLDAGQGGIYGLTTDRLSNVYALGIYSNYLINETDTLTGAGNIFVSKLSKNGSFIWATNSQHAGPNRVELGGIAEDGHGNIFINGLFSDPNYHLSFGADSLVCHTPVSGYPLASDVFTARLGNCSPAAPSLVASGSLRWCGRDSVILTASVAHSYLWSTGDTSRSVLVHQSGIYAVYTADTLGCYAQSAADTVYARPLPVLQAIATQQVHCYGGSDGHISVHASGGTGSITYAYNPPISDTLHLTAGIYMITATDSAGCTAHDSITVTQPATALTLQIDTIHDGAIALPSGATPPYSYLWSNTLTLDTIAQLSSGWYIVTVTDSNECRAVDSAYITGPNGIVNIGTANTVNIYPNPSADVFYVETIAQGRLNIYDVNGNRIYDEMLHTGKNTISAGRWRAGMYLIEMKTSETLYTGKWEKL